jgi:trimeric autotransporter adhesin
MKKIFILSYFLSIISILCLRENSFSQNVGIGITAPAAKLHIKGSEDTSQLVIDANSTQSNTRPLIKLRNSSGTELLRIHSDDTSNLFIGRNAGRVDNATISGGTFNTFIGGSAGRSNTTGWYNTANGESALSSNTTGNANTACGGDALIFNTIGSNNSAFGLSALAYNSSGNYNTANGALALYSNTSGSYNTATGIEALFYNTTGIYNTANGADALLYNTTGSNNTATGRAALFSNTDGLGNTATGAEALYFNTTGQGNTANGASALSKNTIGWLNTANGGAALYSNTTGSYNVAIGDEALHLNTTGGANVAIGSSALSSITISESNTAVGSGAGSLHNVGSFNTFIGSGSNGNADGLFDGVALGVNARTTANYQVRIGNANITSIGGYVNWTNISDGRIKRNIQDNVPGLAFINKLKPVTYNLDLNAADRIIQPAERKDKGGKIIPVMQFETEARKQKEQIVYTGFIAQDVEKAAKEINYDFSGVDAAKNDKDLYGLRYAEFVVPLVKAVQELSKQNDDMKGEIELLKEQNKMLLQLVNKKN